MPNGDKDPFIAHLPHSLEECRKLAENDLRPPRAVCHWIYDDLDVWITSCGQEFNLEDGSPTDNSIRFCPYCGNGVEWEISQEDSDAQDLH